MKLFYTLLLSLTGLLISSHSVAQGSLAALEAKNGFRNVKFGTSPKAYQGMYETKMSKDFGEDINKLYRRNSDKLMLGDIPLSFIEYMTNRGRICKVQIFFYGTENLEKMEKIIRYAYGNPNQIYPPYNLQWVGKKVMLFYTKTKDYEERPWGILEFHSTPIFYEDSRKAKSKINESIEKGASEL